MKIHRLNLNDAFGQFRSIGSLVTAVALIFVHSLLPAF